MSSDELELALGSVGPTDAARLEEIRGAIGDEAERRALIDVSIARLDSPFGQLLVGATGEGLVKLSLPEQDDDEFAAMLTARIGPRLVERPARFEQLVRELDEYFEGGRREFAFPIDWRLSSGFGLEVLRFANSIPYGQTRTYSEVAEGVGRPKANRAAGSALGANPIPLIVPCHRVLRVGGALGGYAGGLPMKQALLELEAG